MEKFPKQSRPYRNAYTPTNYHSNIDPTPLNEQITFKLKIKNIEDVSISINKISKYENNIYY